MKIITKLNREGDLTFSFNAKCPMFAHQQIGSTTATIYLDLPKYLGGERKAITVNDVNLHSYNAYIVYRNAKINYYRQHKDLVKRYYAEKVENLLTS